MAKRLRRLKTTQKKKNRERSAARKLNTVEHEAVIAPKDAPMEPPKETKPLSDTDTKEAVAEETEEAKYHTAKEAAEMLNISAKQVTAFIQDKSLANAFKKSGRWQIPASDIQTLKNKL
jgi:tRNA G26 N,N-dimethylase Trm1